MFDIPSTTISGKSYAQISITPNIPDGYSIVGGIGYTSDAGVHSYLRCWDNNVVIVLRNWADGSNTVTGKFVVFYSK